MLRRTFLLTLAASSLFWSAAIALAAAPACSEMDGWTAGRDGSSADTACTGDDYAQAHRLGAALADLRQQHAELEARIKAGADNVGVLRRQQRQLDVDIEAIRGVAMVRGWPDGVASTPVEEESP